MVNVVRHRLDEHTASLDGKLFSTRVEVHAADGLRLRRARKQLTLVGSMHVGIETVLSQTKLSDTFIDNLLLDF